jgi:hypothetical protein
MQMQMLIAFLPITILKLKIQAKPFTVLTVANADLNWNKMIQSYVNERSENCTKSASRREIRQSNVVLS